MFSQNYPYYYGKYTVGSIIPQLLKQIYHAHRPVNCCLKLSNNIFLSHTVTFLQNWSLVEVIRTSKHYSNCKFINYSVHFVFDFVVID